MLHFAQKRGGVPPSSFGHRAAVAAAAVCVAVLISLLAGQIVLAQEPSPPIVDPTDPRSEGEGPGFGGAPLLAALAVLALGLLAALATALYVRLVARR